ncbi:hypothetical protein HU200_063700 [Digitaria exilis]|uniref:Uncharacterized protein n=1 Tax=Digitaria exilis TaxID=1010633 RepID=A0A835ACY7_9POAL|nr:hypothetical protein HU200_063700 [Digitaria exilis]
MAILKSDKARIMHLAIALLLVLAITSSTFPSCQAGNIIKGPDSPPTTLSVTCYTYRQCDVVGCCNHCAHKGKKKEGCECRTGTDPEQCCCQD